MLPQFPFETFSFAPAYAFEQPWTFVTSVFLHAGAEHLFFNMFALFMFGIYLEPRISERQFLAVFFAAGVLGNVAYMLMSPYGVVPAVGASGAIYGIMGMLAVLQPSLTIYVLYMPMPMIFAAVLWTVTEFLGLFVPSDVGHEAHLFGLAVGFLFGLWVRRQKKKEIFVWEDWI
jgi:membrane associated rhomboid family serine protease